MAGAVDSDDDSVDGFISKRRSVKNTIASDAEDGDSDTAPIHTEDITLCLSDDGENEETNEENNPCLRHDSASQRSISPSVTEGLNAKDGCEDVSKESSVINNSPPSPIVEKPSRVPFQSLIDSDSEPEETSKHSVTSNHSEGGNSSEHSQDVTSTTKEKPKKIKAKSTKRRSIWDSDSDSEEEKHANTTKKTSSVKPSLIDSDSDEADQPQEYFTHEEDVPKKNGKSKSAAGKQKKVNSKDAMLAIRSESQRMTRESPLSLPYHRPKQHSLSDFLNRRRLTPSSMKAPVEELVKFQKESEKEIKEFYQSESEHSDDDKDDDPDWKEEEEKVGDKDETKDEETEGRKEVEDMTATEETENINNENKRTENKEDDENESENKSDADKGVEKQTYEIVEMETDEIVSEGKLEDGKKTEGKNDDLILVNSDKDDLVEKEDCVLIDLENEISRSGCEKAKPVEKEGNTESREESVFTDSRKMDSGKTEDTADSEKTEDTKEQDTETMDEVVEDRSHKQKQTDSCAVDSQNLKLKYSEELSESFELKKLNLDPFSDSEDEDIQMVDLTKTKEAPKLILRGNPDDVIDLCDDFVTYKSKTDDLEDLKNRFMRHALPSKPKASPTTVTLKVVDRAGDGSIKGINEETVTWNTDKAPVDHTPPGLKMKMLKKELQRQIIEQREKEFLEKEASREPEEKPDYEDGEEILDDKEEDDDVEAADVVDEGTAEDDVDGEAEDEDQDDDDEIDEEDEDDEIDEEDEDDVDVSRKKRKNAFVDEEASVDGDSVELDDMNEENEESNDEKPKFSRSGTKLDMFASQISDDDDEIPVYQPCGGRLNPSPLSQPQGTATPSVSSTSKSLRSPEVTQVSPNSSFQRSMRFDNDFNCEESDMSTTQFLGLGLKKFTADETEKTNDIMQLAQSPEALETEADLMAMCSGQFVTQPFSSESQAGSLNALADSQDSQDLQLKWTEDSPIDESKSQKKVKATRLVIESSDEEDNNDEAVTKRKTKRLSFSDDESNSMGVDDFINDEEEEEEGEEDLPAPEDVMYDSDENEIPVKAAAFLENEAELSEDDYVGSGDEDEGGDNDQMEEELGDMDDIDQDKVREELGRIHMRNLLDDDRRDVRLMQEMLFEDGEDHEDGKGRQRQFRWKNADAAALLMSQTAGPDEEGQDDEDDDDGAWIQNRHEREMFLANCLKEKTEKGDVIELEEQEDSEIIILGKNVLKRQSSTRIEVKETVSKPQQQVAIPDSPMKSLFSRTRARGSFLSRTSDVLTRLAENASGKNGIVEIKTKNSRNFVFAAVSPPKNEDNEANTENELRPNTKRKAKRSLIAQPEKKTCTSQSTKYSGLFDYL